MDSELLYKDEVYAIQGAIFAVYAEMGSGILEEVYQECLERELKARGIPFEAQVDSGLTYKGQLIKKAYRADVICYGKLILELKSVKTLLPEHDAQLLNYLKATGMRLGLLVNFNHYSDVAIHRRIL